MWPLQANSFVSVFVAEGVAVPLLLVEAGSPHTTLKPSQAKYLQKANAVFWVVHDVETFPEKPLESIPKIRWWLNWVRLRALLN